MSSSGFCDRISKRLSSLIKGIVNPDLVLTEYEVPVEQRAKVIVEVERPDRTTTQIPLIEVEPGVFEGEMPASLSGIYRLLFRGEGTTWHGLHFTREELRTVAVWRSGDAPPPTSKMDTRSRDEQVCHLLECILNEESVVKFLHKHEIDQKQVSSCLRRFCQERLGSHSDKQLEVQPQRISPRMMSELRSLLGSAKADEFVTMLSRIARKSEQ